MLEPQHNHNGLEPTKEAYRCDGSRALGLVFVVWGRRSQWGNSGAPTGTQ